MKIDIYYAKTFLLLFFSVLASCSSGGDGNSEQPPTNQNPPPTNQTNPPAKAVGSVPANGEPCSDYVEVVDDDTKVSVAFSWNAAQFAESYILVIIEGTNEVFRSSFNGLQAQAVLDRGRTYTWLVISVNGNGQTNGDTFSFTTPGTPIGNFAPYAAEITVDFETASSEMTVFWIGSDEDGDALTYDVTILEEGDLIFESLDLTDSTVGPITFVSDFDYEIEVISRDASGNFSVSKMSVTSPN